MEMMMTRQSPFVVSVDLEADAAYIQMTNREVARTVDLGGGVMVDVDDLGVVVGVEVLRVDATIPFDRLTTEFHVHTSDVELLRALQPSIAGSLMQQSADGISYRNSNRGSIARVDSERLASVR